MKTLDVAFASCRDMPDCDPDQHLLSTALQEAGFTCSVLSWDDPAANFNQHRLTILRSTWNYIHHINAFLYWVDHVQSQLLNPATIVHWNAHKKYLIELAKNNVCCVPTLLVPKGNAISLATLVEANKWPCVIAKPAVGASSFKTRKLELKSHDEAWFQHTVSERDMLLQPYLLTVEMHGEKSLIFIDMNFSHAVHKSQRLEHQQELASCHCIHVDADEQALAEQALNYVSKTKLCSPLLYARVDIARDSNNNACIMELELIEPSLFFQQSPQGLRRFITAIEKRIHI